MAAVEVSNLAKTYGPVTALVDVSFTAVAGEITAVLGPNGAGKTTTMDICCGLRTADGGSVSVLGLNPRRDASRLTSRVGVMPQGGSTASGVYPSARVGEVLRLFAALHAEPIPVEALLARLGLTDVASTPWRRLSGGEQQRLSLALAVIGRPEVAFLDEPTAGLDVEGRHATWELITDLRSAGVAVVLTTHAMDEAETIADSIVIVDGGHVVASGSPASLTRSGGPSTELRFEGPPGLPLDNLATALPAGLELTEPSAGRYLVTGPITPAVVASLTSWCADRGVLPDRLTTGGRTLEDLFLSLTGKATTT